MTISTEQAAYDLLGKLLNNEVDATKIIIDFSSAKWAKFHLKLEGEAYKSTINSDLMRALVEYQNTLFRVAAFFESGRLNAGALDESSRYSLRVNFKVENGSADFSGELIGRWGF